MTVVLHATFDGEDYEVNGSPLMDTIACTRPAPHVIACTGKKTGAVTLTDTLTASRDGEVLTLIYSIFDGHQEVAKGTAEAYVGCPSCAATPSPVHGQSWPLDE